MTGKWVPKSQRKSVMPEDYKSQHELEEEKAQQQDITKISDNLFLSGQLGTKACQYIRDLGITHVLTLGMDGPQSSHHEIQYKSIKKEDLVYEDLLSCFPEAIDFIASSTACLIHCHKGVSRSATICVAYLMAVKQCTLDAAMKLVQGCRPIVNPNWGFRRQLRLFEAMSCQLSGPVFNWYVKEVAGSQDVHPATFRDNPDVSIDPATYVSADQVQEVPQAAPDSVYGLRACKRVLVTPVHITALHDDAICIERMHWMQIEGEEVSCDGHVVGRLQDGVPRISLAKVVPMTIV